MNDAKHSSEQGSGKCNIMPDNKTARRLSDSQRDTTRHISIGKPRHTPIGKTMAAGENDERA